MKPDRETEIGPISVIQTTSRAGRQTGVSSSTLYKGEGHLDQHGDQGLSQDQNYQKDSEIEKFKLENQALKMLVAQKDRPASAAGD
jgi:hypothetical protein